MVGVWLPTAYAGLSVGAASKLQVFDDGKTRDSVQTMALQGPLMTQNRLW